MRNPVRISAQNWTRTMRPRRSHRGEMRHILDSQDVYGDDFPGEMFRVLKDKEIKQYGEYRTRRSVLEKWDRMQAKS